MELVSHGFVVAAVEHRDNSACMSFYAKQMRMSMNSSNPALDITELDGEDDIDFFDELDDPNYIPPRALASVSSVPHITMQWISFIRVPLNR